MSGSRISPEEARSAVLAQLRLHNYKGRTSELAEWTGLPSPIVRRAGLYLTSRKQLDAVLVPGKGKGEYQFEITQLDLFADTPEKLTVWQKIKRWMK